MDAYEAYIVVLFMSLMCEYLGGKDQVSEVIEEMLPFKFLICITVHPSLTVYRVLRAVIFQFAFFKTFFSIGRCILYYLMHHFHTIPLNLKILFPVFQILTLISLMTAMLGLLNFYKMFAPALSPYKVTAKFMAIKLFIFLHLVQGLIFSLFETPENHFHLAQLEYFILCLEMAFAAFLLKYVIFTYREFLSDTTPQKPWFEYFRLDETRLNEWKDILSSPHMVRQDAYFAETTRVANRQSTRSTNFSINGGPGTDNYYRIQSNYSTMINNVYY